MLSNINISRSLRSVCYYFIVLEGNSALFRFYEVARSYSSRPFLCALDLHDASCHTLLTNFCFTILALGLLPWHDELSSTTDSITSTSYNSETYLYGVNQMNSIGMNPSTPQFLNQELMSAAKERPTAIHS